MKQTLDLCYKADSSNYTNSEAGEGGGDLKFSKPNCLTYNI